ncbi:DUF3866 family protein [Alkaliphilus hydrothermalis]|uniref:DUF3866 domain-containing protein n=1 Tax=Alkaliphilus hydrothermalis TaxID=1482730 RepID=A0ABS2NM73_9FIRM|nr:DUF3866 family protein [Alkaliphilus hydrothermalis]MBM7614023.1 hypothetical protein [Alkaliphilus hydrothermalis]
MISIEKGTVKEIIKKHSKRTDILVEVDGRKEKAINYDEMTGEVQVGNPVILNTTAVKLGLGTGGYHFVLHNLAQEQKEMPMGGHIMKLRYTPQQIKVFAAEEQESQYHRAFLDFESLGTMPVLVGTLHSMLMPLVATLKYLNPQIKIAYIMTDGAALPIALSNTVELLKKNGIIDTTITIGHAFGGDLECVNVYNGLIAAKEIALCDIAIVVMGPGIVGTGTPFGFTGIEQGINLDAVEVLGGIPIAVPRISFADGRERHKGISHHSLTVLDKICRGKSRVVLPLLVGQERELVHHQIKNLKIDEKHYIVEENGNIVFDALEHFDFTVSTMGRGVKEDAAFFLTCGAAASYGMTLI